jgi:hypothetical protein
MSRIAFALLVGTVVCLPGHAQTPSSDPKPERVKTGRPGELTEAEEKKIDEIIQKFILFDIGQLPASQGRQVMADFNALGPESIPALIRGLNYSATLSHSCPVGVISKKLRTLLSSSEDERVLEFARDSIGVGVMNTPYAGILRELKLVTVYRARILSNRKFQTPPKPPTTRPSPIPSPGQPSPGQPSPGEVRR